MHAHTHTHTHTYIHTYIRGCIQKFPDWPLGARTGNGTALCHQVQLYRCFMSQYCEFCRHNTLCCFSTSVYCCKHISYFIIDSVRKLLVTSSYIKLHRTRREVLKTSCARETAVTLSERSPLILRHLSNNTGYVMPTTSWSLPQFSSFSPRNTISNSEGSAIIQVQVHVVQFVFLLCFITGIVTYCSLLLFIANATHFTLITGYGLA
jgi:hypothetical protein